jgi:hypothetical protein
MVRTFVFIVVPVIYCFCFESIGASNRERVAQRGGRCFEIIRSFFQGRREVKHSEDPQVARNIHFDMSLEELDFIFSDKLHDSSVVARQNAALADVAYSLKIDWDSFSDQEERALRICFLSNDEFLKAGILKRITWYELRLHILFTNFSGKQFAILKRLPFVVHGLPCGNLDSHFADVISRDVDRLIGRQIGAACQNLDAVEDPRNPFTWLVREYPSTSDLRSAAERLKKN